MKYLILLICVFCTVRLPFAVAQNEEWDTYMVKMGNAPASVLLDMSLIDIAPDKKFPYLVITGPKTKNCNTMGIPDKDEINVLEDILSTTGNFLTGLTPKVLAGTVTRNCERVNYYYVKDTVGIRTALNRVYTRTYKNNAYVIGIKADPEWDTYRKFLYPDEEIHNWMDNDKIISKMLQKGDSLKSQRDITFTFYFQSDSDRAGFVDFARLKGYKVDELKSANIPKAPYEVILSAKKLVKMEIIGPITMELKVEARKYRGIYLGWEAK